MKKERKKRKGISKMVEKERKAKHGMDGKKWERNNRKTEHGYIERRGWTYEIKTVREKRVKEKEYDRRKEK